MIQLLLEQKSGELSVDFSTVFPYEDRNDGMDYDEMLFGRLFQKRMRLRPAVVLSRPFRMPGSGDWNTDLDERDGDGARFAAKRLFDGIDEYHQVAGGVFAGIDLICAGNPPLAQALEQLLIEELGYSPRQIRRIDGIRRQCSRCSLFAWPLWEEQVGRVLEPASGIGRESGLRRPFPQVPTPVAALENSLDGLESYWQRFLLARYRRNFSQSRANIHRLRNQIREENWPFQGFTSEHAATGLQIGGAAPTAEPSFAGLQDVLDQAIGPRSEERWYREFLLTLEESLK